jgi:Tetracyclin repressor-like, C-terminal domain
VSDRSPLADTGTLAGDIRAHSITLMNDLTGGNRRFLLRALIIAGDDAGDEGDQQALIERTGHVAAMFKRAARRGERSTDPRDYFEGVVGPLYGYALMMPGLVRTRGPVLVEEFIANLAPHTTPQG